MPNYNYVLPEGIINAEQTQYMVDAFHKSVDVLFAPFGDLTKLEDFRAHADKLDDVFGTGATEASTDINTTGYTHFGEATRNALFLVHYVREMADSTSFGSFNEAQGHFETYYEDDLVDFIVMYKIDDDA